jgi:hypothetical protein
MTITLSASRMVLRRWAMTKDVRPPSAARLNAGGLSEAKPKPSGILEILGALEC